MSQIPSSLFKHSLVAVAVVTLSGCATTAREGSQEGSLASDVGNGLVTAGQKTMGFGATVWQRTGYLLGLNDDPGVPLENASGQASADAALADPAAAPRVVAIASPVPTAKLPLHLDEVDLAMMEEDAIMPNAVVVAPAVTLADASPPRGADDALLLGATADDAFDVVPFEDVESIESLASIDDVERAVAGAPAAAMPQAPERMAAIVASAAAPTSATAPAAEPAPVVAVVAASDLEHRVGESETLWDIAKLTTGDATNWHVLADVNDLGPGASVFPGQTLTIPADMLRPELAGASAVAVPVVEVPVVAVAPAEARPALEAVAAAPQERLVVPGTVSPVAPAVSEPGDDAKPFSIDAGETLWDFAKRTTGDATNWQAIATQNGFDEKAAVAVREGQTIYVPHAMVKDRSTSAVAATPAATPDAPAAAPAAEPARVASNGQALEPIPQVGDTRTVGDTIDASAAVLAGNNGVDAPVGETIDGYAQGRDIRIVEAAFTGGADAGVPAAGDAPQSILISGTYYPKAVYSDADFSAGLLMRVSPGTRLNVSSVDGQWYQVETEQGMGWIHRRDTK